MVEFNSISANRSRPLLWLAVMAEEIRLSRFSPSTQRELLSYAPFEGANKEELEKPLFLFGNFILVYEESLFEDEY